MGATDPPAWAADLVDRACAFLGAAGRPVVVWHREDRPAQLTHGRRQTPSIDGVTYRPGDLSAGWVHRGVVEVWPGRIRRDQRLTLLHELAHWHADRGGHGRAFWDTAWRLYRRFMPRSLRYALASEAAYRTGALHAAVRAGVVDAERALLDPYLRRAVPSAGR